MIRKLLNKISLKKQTDTQQVTTPKETTPFNPRTRMNSENMTDEEKLKQGFNGSTYSINGRDVDF
ncbi:MAG: hypothetical protein CMF52_08755 [Legionellales bacterium]|nr:hypothetical protein [Legionellales bacterium]